jgi:putative Mg2+ transporter-C (MgtC) family protein
MPVLFSTIAGHLAWAWAAGSLIGLERSHNGRAAGFRTHALVALAAAAVMTLSFQPVQIAGAFPLAQGVMTGVGFLGAGVIFKEGVSVQGLTTAACLWATSAIGLLFGQGLIEAGQMVTVAVLVTLVVFRWLENILPERVYAAATFRFHAGVAPTEDGLRDLLGRHKITLSDISYGLLDGGEVFEFRASLQTSRRSGLTALAATLRTTDGLSEFQLLRISK